MPRYLSIFLQPRENGALPLPAIADWCRRFTPLAALDAPDGVMLDISGVSPIFGGEAAMLAHLEDELTRRGFPARAAIAPTPEAANALARFGERALARRIISAQADERAIARAVTHLPVQALRLEDSVAIALSQSGLKRIGDIWLRPRAPLTARFGKALFATLDAMMGRTKSAITPRFEAPTYIAERRFMDGIVARERIEETIAALAGDLAQMLARHGEGARRMMAALFRVDGRVMHVDCATSRPLRDAGIIARLFREKIEAAAAANAHDPLDVGYGFDLIRLAVMQAEKLPQQQSQMSASAEHRQSEDSLADFLDRMRARFGAHSVLQFVAGDSHLPEHAVTASRDIRPHPEEQSQAASRRMSWKARSSSQTSFETLAAQASQDETAAGRTSHHRPIRLFEKAEPVEALALVPDGPPLKFRWRRAMHEVAAFEGPERIAPEWWKGHEAALTRDYFRVEDTSGRRFWLYREGLYERETQRPRWFMHGVFG